VSSDPRVGTQLGEYRIESLLGRGGMSVVYLAEHVRLKRKAAVKLLSPELAEDPTFRARFVSEWERLAQLDHPNIIPVFEAGESDGFLYIAMRYVRSTDLKGLIEHEGRLDAQRSVSIIAQTASALDAAHQQNLVHRDVKPANILIATGAGPEGTDHVYLSDFGLTKHTESQSGLTQTGHFMGTIDYVAPEQISGKGVDGRTDQYALGCVLYQCLTGRVPFPREEDTASLFAHLQDPPPKVTEARPDLDPDIDGVIERAMSKSKDDRYASCADLARAARQALGVQGVAISTAPPVVHVTETVLAAPPVAVAADAMATAAPTTPDARTFAPPPPPPAPVLGGPPHGPVEPKGSRRGMLVGGGIAALVGLAVVGFLVFGGGDEEPGPDGATGVTSGQPELITLVFDDFVDNDQQWEAQPQNGITRLPSLNERYRFEITDQAEPNAFAVSVGGARGFIRADQRVIVSTTLVRKGGGGLTNSFGVTCRYTGQDGYYFLIGSDGRFAIEKLVAGGLPEFLSDGENVAIRPGRASNLVEARCVGGADGSPATLSLIVNDQVVETVTDDDPILEGVGGVAITGQPGLVVDFDDFEFAEILAP
jgi:tRNA A-37 threonylcarbamoyl transferase component Bud32